MVSQPPSRDPISEIQQILKGDRNQVIASLSDNAKAIGNVTGNVTFNENHLHQPLPRQLSLHQLPNDIADFTGRNTELQQITQLLQTSGNRTAVAISAVAGMPGVGKSALAVHVAHQLQPQFPDAQLYINLRGTDDSPLEPFDALAQLLRAFGLDDSTLPTDLPGRANAYRSLLAQKRAIILLDNASSEAQVRDLIPGSPASAVIITSRRRLSALAGIEVLDLSVMPASEALDLLQRLIGIDRVQPEPAAAAQIVQLCGQLPLAIRIAGGTLNQKRYWSLATYATKLRDEKQRLAQLQLSDLDVRSSFQLSYQDLSATDAHLFQFLGLLPRDFAAPAAAALVDQSPEAIAAAVERLVEAQLLEAVSEDRYQFHDLIRLFAQEQLGREQSPEMQQAAQQRLVQWYGEQAGFWSNVFNPIRRRQLIEAFLAQQDSDFSTAELEQKAYLTGLAWFELERANLLTIMDWADQLQAREQVINLAANLVPFFSVRSYWSNWVKTHQLALAVTRQTGDQQSEGTTVANLGEAYRRQGRWAEAVECFQQSQPIFHALGDQQNEGKTVMNLGAVYLQQGRWAEATECFQQSQPIFHALGDQQNEGTTVANLGRLYAEQNQPQQAIAHWQEALTKLHPDSPEAQQVAQWLTAPASPSRNQILFGYLIWLVIIAFIVFNLWRGHWFIALAAALLFAGFIAFHYWRSRQGRQAP